jgi:hypothetical protein
MKKTIKFLFGLVMAVILLAGVAQAGTPHTSYGNVLSASTATSWKLYVVARPTETLTGSLVGTGPWAYQALVGNLTSPWSAGEDSVAIMWRDDNAGTITHTGYYTVMNESLLAGTPQRYADATLRAIPIPTATPGSGQVAVSWTAATQDQYENPPTLTGSNGNTAGANIIGYNVYRSTNGIAFTKVNTTVVAGTSYNDTTGAPGTAYYYAIEIVYKGSVVAGSGTAITSANSALVTFPTTPPNITTTTLPNGIVGVAYNQTLAATGGTTPYTWSVSAGTLPAGLSLSSGGVISGTPTTAGGPTSFTVQVSGGGTDTQVLAITINAAVNITTTTLPAGTVGVAYNQTLAATGGTGTYAWSVSAGTLPAGLSLSSGGVISGTPTTANTYSFTVQAVSGGSTDTQALSIIISYPAVNITTTTLPNGTVAVPYSQTLLATGGNGTYTWTVTAGSLPTGLSLSSAGVISGTPTTAQVASFTVQASSAGLTDTQALSITIGTVVIPLNIDTTSLPGGTVGTAYNQTLVASGGSAPYTWTISAGTLPAGLSMSTAGVITGTPTTANTYSFTARVQDAVAAFDTQALSIVISAVPPTGPTITRLEMTSAPGVAITSANIGDNISLVGTNYGAAQGTSTITINGTPVTAVYYWSAGGDKVDFAVPTGATSGNVVITVSGLTASIPLTIGGGGTAPSIGSITPSTAAVGQTIVIAGSNFGTSGTITIGGVAASPTSWTDGSIIVAVPAGVTPGTATVTVTTGGGSGSATMTIDNGAIGSVYIDDYEGGCVGTWTAPAASSGYYTFGAGVTPDNSSISTSGPDAAAVKDGAKGMKVRYTFTSGWGGGWGAKLASARNLTSVNYVSFWVNWDGSTNSVKLGLKDADGTSFATTVANATLAASGWHRITVAKTAFAYDADGSDAGANATMDWTTVAGYNFIYNTSGTAANYQLIDSLIGSTSAPTDEAPVTGESTVISVSPEAAPTGAKIVISYVSGKTFGSAQSRSLVVFTNKLTMASEKNVSIINWSNTAIEAIVPNLTAGDYDITVWVAPSASDIDSFSTNPDAFKVTASAAGGDIATLYPNPFNPNSEAINIIANNIGGATNVTAYIFDMTAHQVARIPMDISGSTAQKTWNGTDLTGAVVGDGAFILRVINEDTKSLIARGKILVVKR